MQRCASGGGILKRGFAQREENALLIERLPLFPNVHFVIEIGTGQARARQPEGQPDFLPTRPDPSSTCPTRSLKLCYFKDQK